MRQCLPFPSPSDYPMSSPMAQLLQQYDWFAALAGEHRALVAATTQLRSLLCFQLRVR